MKLFLVISILTAAQDSTFSAEKFLSLPSFVMSSARTAIWNHSAVEVVVNAF
jgi:hypothetical protein